MTLFQFMDFRATDFCQVYPDIRPGIGGVWHLRWDQWNPAQGEYNTSVIAKWLEAESKNRLHDGEPKPLMAMLLCHTAPDGTNAQGVDYSPGWVKAACPSLTATASNGTTALMPAYNDARWWTYLADAVQALGIYLDGLPQLAYVGIGHGCDAELWAMKAPWNQKLPGGTERGFSEGTVKLFDVYAAAFPETHLLARATPGSGRRYFTQEAIKRGIGVQMCGAQVKAQNAHGWGNEYGTWDMLRDAVAAGVPAVAETTTGMGSSEARYWTILGMVSMKVWAMDCHPEWFDAGKVDPAFWTWTDAHMGHLAQTAPSAWCVLRDYDTSCGPIEWTGSNGVKSGQSDWPGDFCYYLTRTSPDADAPRVEDCGPSDAVESRQARRVTSATFEVDAGFAPPPYRVSVRYLAEPGAFLQFGDTSLQVIGGDPAWATATGTVNARTFPLTGNSAAVHRVTVEPLPEVDPPEPPVEEPPPVDWAGMRTLIDGAQVRLDSLDAARGEMQTALCDAQVALTEVETQRNAAYADLAALRALVQAAQAGAQSEEVEAGW